MRESSRSKLSGMCPVCTRRHHHPLPPGFSVTVHSKRLRVIFSQQSLATVHSEGLKGSIKFVPPNHCRRLRTTCGRMAIATEPCGIGGRRQTGRNTRMHGPWSDWWTWKSSESEVRDFEGSLRRRGELPY